MFGRVAEPELEVDRRADPHDLGNLVVANETADVVRHLDVDVERHVDHCPDRGQLRKRQIGRHVEGGHAALFEELDRGRIRTRRA